MFPLARPQHTLWLSLAVGHTSTAYITVMVLPSDGLLGSADGTHPLQSVATTVAAPSRSLSPHVVTRHLHCALPTTFTQPRTGHRTNRPALCL
ncbi:hypothetical protein LSM04_008820 [Trypanosoma melophagium]|uniref:uncharacterized protein n=1 Tax=Trypanosoma melophagium TaxID=715481 RepID=UPI00351A1734|nr:hypothetical protein LSM04_000874 [Trypanosoma melophagium]KAH9601003.1 hypothetical protein LSM04_006413 [Trypanosoma melophagium]KAH9601060.1 hypothetical protein LSM04_008820 [Trypanosoma melophagium]